MKSITRCALIFVALALICSNVFGQTSGAEGQTRPRTVSKLPQQPAQESAQESVRQATTQTDIPATIEPAKEAVTTEVSSRPSSMVLTPPLIQSRITEAKRLLKSRPMNTALTTTPNIGFVTIAALDRASQRTHLITLSKETFLQKGSEVTLPSSLGTLLTIRVLRANGVNTALTISTPDGKELTPLTVEYPIEHRGLFTEMAYYSSAHPALLSKDLVNSGQAYVRNMLDLAVRRLGERGVAISPDILNVAERLCIVEHIDHERFRAENRQALYEEIYSLYALNQLDTYRYSVSSAGAGGMVQMIPWAYNLIRQRHPGVGLIPDFVTGMRNHANALQAMLLYMQDTWNDLTVNEDIKYALNAKIATTPELLAAAYNSNAAKLPGYINKGNEEWRLLIPRETQMYLQIYKSFEALVPITPRTPVAIAAGN
jgi:hypothetical protein